MSEEKAARRAYGTPQKCRKRRVFHAAAMHGNMLICPFENEAIICDNKPFDYGLTTRSLIITTLSKHLECAQDLSEEIIIHRINHAQPKIPLLLLL